MYLECICIGLIFLIAILIGIYLFVQKENFKYNRNRLIIPKLSAFYKKRLAPQHKYTNILYKDKKRKAKGQTYNN